MRRESVWACLALTALAARLAAWGGTPLPWLGGTEGWDTTPAGECDLAALGSGGAGATRLGGSLQAGLRDDLQAEASWEGARGASSLGSAALRWRQAYASDTLPSASAYVRADTLGGAWAPWAGVDLAEAPGETDFALNAEASPCGQWRVRLAGWTPYLLPTLRLGLEASWLDAASEGILPQAVVNGPGDVSLQFGARLDPRGGPPTWLLRLSYELFPNP